MYSYTLLYVYTALFEDVTLIGAYFSQTLGSNILLQDGTLFFDCKFNTSILTIKKRYSR